MIGTPLTKTIKIDPDQVQERNGQEHIRNYDKVNNAVFQDMLDELKGLHKTIKIIHNLEI